MKHKNSRNSPNPDLKKPTPDEIAAAAYHLYVDSGYQDGHDQEHWMRAEQLLTEKLKSAPQAAVAASQPTGPGQGADTRTKTTSNKPASIQLPWNPEQAARPTAQRSASRAA